jgi:hypothetical protein
VSRRPKSVRGLAGGLLLAAGPALIVLALLVPVVALDPVRGVTGSNSPFTDEAWSVTNARAWALSGTFAPDEWALYLLNLPFTVVDGLVFRLFGVGIVQARLVDVACVAATAALLGAGLRRPFGGPAAFLAATGFATTSLVLFYGRMALLEPMVGLFLTAGVLTLLAVDGPRAGRMGILGGLFLALTVGTKAIALPAAAAVFVVAAIAGVRLRPARRWLAGAGVTFALSGLVWLVTVYLPNASAVADIGHRVYPSVSPITARRAVARLFAFVRGGGDGAALLVAPLILVAIGGTVVRITRRAQQAPGATVLLAASGAGIAAGVAAVAVAGYAPNRYLVPLVPLVAILSAPAFRAVVDAAASVDRRRTGRNHGLAVAASIAALGILVAAPGVLQHAGWMAGAGRQLVAAQAAAAAVLPDGAIVAGPDATLLAMTSRAHVVLTCCTNGGVNRGDLYAAGARWWAGSQRPAWAADHPEAWAAAEVVTCLHDWRRPPVEVCLWRLP